MSTWVWIGIAVAAYFLLSGSAPSSGGSGAAQTSVVDAMIEGVMYKGRWIGQTFIPIDGYGIDETGPYYNVWDAVNLWHKDYELE